MIESKQLSVVVQGVVERKITHKCLRSLRKNLPDAEIILSTWEGSDISKLKGLYDIVILNRDPGAIVFDDISGKANNLNRILTTAKSGIAAASREYILKIRSDLILKNNNFLNLTDDFALRNPNNILFKQRIFAYENFSIKYDYKFKSKQRMLFHISDWCHFGLKEDLKELFNIPLVKEPEFSRYFETHSKQVNDIHKPRLWKMSPEQYITSANAAKVFPSLNFETYLDRTDKNTQISEEFIINNFRIFSAKDWGMACLKIPYNTYNIAVNSPFDYYSDVEQKLDYKKYCDPSIEIPDYKFLKQVFSLKYFESLRRHFLQLIFCPWIRKPSEIASTALYFFLFLFALIKKD